MSTKTLGKAQCKILEDDSRAQIPWLIHGFSTRSGGFSKVYGGKALNLGFTQQDSNIAVERNRRAFLRQLGALDKDRSWPLITLRQIHSDLIHCVSGVPKSTFAGDGLVTQTTGILLAILTADCLPVIIVDAKRRAVGIFWPIVPRSSCVRCPKRRTRIWPSTTSKR